MKISMLEDDPSDGDFMRQTLSGAGHLCDVFTEGRALVRQLGHQTYDLLVLDWNVPDLSGEHVLHWVRTNLSAYLPILFVTNRSQDTDVASMLVTRADDYIVKPVPARLLLARVGALLRRGYQPEATASKEVFGEYEFDVGARILRMRRVVIGLTPKEFDLAWLLFQHLDRPLARAHILATVWRQPSDISLSRTVDAHISVLRTKLNLRPEHGYRLRPLYGYGYRLERTAKMAE